MNMATTKVSLTLDKRELSEARRLVGPRELSMYVNDALRQANRRRKLISYLDELETSHPISEPAKAEGDRIWESLVSSSTAAASQRSRRKKK
jgi:hypothetical protein